MSDLWIRRTVALPLIFLAFAAEAFAATPGAEVTLIHMGDVHGHLVEHPNVRSDGNGASMGGLARMYTVIKGIRQRHPGATITVNSGDTVQGSAEALFTQGEAIITVLNRFAIDVDNPGNWDYLYGTDVFLQQFAGPDARFHANAIAANLYYDGPPYATKTGNRVLPPYWITEVNGLKIGFIGYTASRGPQAVKTEITRGFRMTEGEAEFPEFIRVLRDIKQVDVLVVISELGLAANIDLSNRNPGIDVILSSDMHETTPHTIRTHTGAWVVDEGQDGQVLNEMTLRKHNGRVSLVKFTQHRITMDIRPDPEIDALVKKVRAPFVTGPAFVPGRWINPFNGTALMHPIDTIVGYTDVPLYRANFSDEKMPAVIEGSSHDFLTDAFRSVARTDVGVIRGFRYGTHVSAGPVSYEDIYHFIPIGPLIAKGTITGHQIHRLVDDSAYACLSTDVSFGWTGGWVAGLSGVTLDFDPYGGRLNYSSNYMVGGIPMDEQKRYSVAGYFYKEDPEEINRLRTKNLEVLKDSNGQPMDAVEVVAQYLSSLPAHRVTKETLKLDRFRLLRKLPAPLYGNREIQPLGGVPVEP
ncbi:bifunctional UDP-sugar hydrolase/5'-nucleotidase [Herbaspirillum sp. RV1423]|uniref:bifunctional metallophosphatase/5'-nucleotidase n=1 Tax=Herbaspirillum sp. RV1423 TaxID=1443993 RepID=UPI00054DEA1F|nr:bifunctional metallophosphatase/5'-nucleotidase [Herbaspirillum sp. RV1423]